MRRHVVVRAAWDEEAGVWYVEDSDIEGLATEADTLEALRQRLRIVIPDLLSERDDLPGSIEVDLIAYAHDHMTLDAA
jgi:predicted RNase H-like HicB family nuclease